jgi:hypothetical protein
MDIDFIREFRTKVLEGTEDGRKFFESLGAKEPKYIINLCRWIISDVQFEERPDIVKAAFHQLAHLRDVASLDSLLELKGRWKNTYLSEFEYLVALLENAKNGAVCNCEVYADGRFNTPPYQDDLEIIGRQSRYIENFGSIEILHIQCKICGAEWEVEIDHHYHYPHSHWRRKTKYV